MPAMTAVALALLLLPGLLVVRAPWTAVPALSLAFWVVSTAWLPARVSRAGFVAGALVCFGALALLRLLPKHEVPAPPGHEPPPRPPAPPRPGLAPPALASAASALVALAAAAVLGPAPLWGNAPGEQLAFETTAARLVLWRDGLPLSAEPLLPLTPFTAHAPALSSLAADVSSLADLDPAPALVLVVAAAATLVAIGLYALHALRLAPPTAAVAAVLSLALVPWPGGLAALGSGPSLLALAFVLPASALLVGHASRSSGWAAALLLAAGLLSHPVLASVVFVLPAAGPRLRPPPARLVAIAVGAAALAGPILTRLLRGASASEWLWRLTSADTREALELAVAAGLLLLVPLLLGRQTAAGHPPVLGRRAKFALGVVAALLLGLRHHSWMAQGQLDPAQRAWLLRAQAATRPLDVVCAAGFAGAWLPALAGRAAEPVGWLPAVYRDELVSRPPRPCRPLPGSR